jgi:hypothetical protein
MALGTVLSEIPIMNILMADCTLPGLHLREKVSVHGMLFLGGLEHLICFHMAFLALQLFMFAVNLITRI